MTKEPKRPVLAPDDEPRSPSVASAAQASPVLAPWVDAPPPSSGGAPSKSGPVLAPGSAPPGALPVPPAGPPSARSSGGDEVIEGGALTADALHQLGEVLGKVERDERPAVMALYWESHATEVDLVRRPPMAGDLRRVYDRTLDSLGASSRNETLRDRAKKCQRRLADVGVGPLADETDEAWCERLLAKLWEHELTRLAKAARYYVDKPGELRVVGVQRNRLRALIEWEYGFSPDGAMEALQERGFSFEESHSRIWVPCDVFQTHPKLIEEVAQQALLYESDAYGGVVGRRFSSWLERSGFRESDEFNRVTRLEDEAAAEKTARGLIVHRLAWALCSTEIALGKTPTLFASPEEIAAAVEAGTLPWSAVEKSASSGVLVEWFEGRRRESLRRVAAEYQRTQNQSDSQRLRWAIGLPLKFSTVPNRSFHTPAELAEAIVADASVRDAAFMAARDGVLSEWLAEVPGTASDPTWARELSDAVQALRNGDQYTFWLGAFRHVGRPVLATQTLRNGNVPIVSIQSLSNTAQVAQVWDPLKNDHFRIARLHAWLAVLAPEHTRVVAASPRPPQRLDAELNRLLWDFRLAIEGKVGGMVLECGSEDRAINVPDDLLRACKEDPTNAELQAIERYPFEWLARAEHSTERAREVAERALAEVLPRADIGDAERFAALIIAAATAANEDLSARVDHLAARLRADGRLPSLGDVKRALGWLEPSSRSHAVRTRPPQGAAQLTPRQASRWPWGGLIVLAALLGAYALHDEYPQLLAAAPNTTTEGALRAAPLPSSPRCVFERGLRQLGEHASPEAGVEALAYAGDNVAFSWVTPPVAANGRESVASAHINLTNRTVEQKASEVRDELRGNAVAARRIGRAALVLGGVDGYEVHADVVDQTMEEQVVGCLGEFKARALSSYDQAPGVAAPPAPLPELPWMYFCRTLGARDPFIVGLRVLADGTGIRPSAQLFASRPSGEEDLGALDLPREALAQADPITWLQEHPGEQGERALPNGMRGVEVAGRGYAITFEYRQRAYFAWLDEALRPVTRPAPVPVPRGLVRAPRLAVSGNRVLLMVPVADEHRSLWGIWATTVPFGQNPRGLGQVQTSARPDEHSHDPTAVALPAGGWLLAYSVRTHAPGAGGAPRVAMVVLDERLTPQGSPLLLEGEGGDAAPALAAHSDGRFALAWLRGTDARSRLVFVTTGRCDSR